VFFEGGDLEEFVPFEMTRFLAGEKSYYECFELWKSFDGFANGASSPDLFSYLHMYMQTCALHEQKWVA
jgi:hypothetical protein